MEVEFPAFVAVMPWVHGRWEYFTTVAREKGFFLRRFFFCVEKPVIGFFFVLLVDVWIGGCLARWREVCSGLPLGPFCVVE